MADQYPLLTEATVADHIRARPDLVRRIDPDSLTAEEIGDGNLNLVFLCRDGAGRSVVLKQSVPYVRAAGPSWPLTADRSHAEAHGLAESFRASPTTSVELFAYDATNHVLVMEDLSRLTTLRTALTAGHRPIDVGEACGRHVARLLFATGMLGRAPIEVRAARQRAANPALCQITEDLVFTEPFIDHPNNRFDHAIAGCVAELRADPLVRDAVSRLKIEFTTRTDSLIHGDLHTGSVMVGPTGETKVIDAEFCFHGPIAFDLGTLLANLLFAAVRASSVGDDAQRAWIESVPAQMWRAFTDELWALWPDRADPTLTDPSAHSAIDRIARDAVGFAGCEAIRRVVGFAKVADLETLPPDQRARAARTVLATARGWLLNPVHPCTPGFPAEGRRG